MSVEIAHVIRGGEVESIHRGDIVAVNSSKKIIINYGDENKRTFWRSAAKPFQAIPLVEAGGLEKFELNLKELALMTSSHGGEKKHVEVVRNILNKLDKDIEDLDCGISNPMYKKALISFIKEGKDITEANNPCSGKHAGMIALGIIRDYDLNNYISVDHPIQNEMLNIISNMTDLDKDEIDIAVDGCGVPVFGLPIKNMAIAYSKLAERNEGGTNMEYALNKISEAMRKYPFYVAGTKRLDTILMEETNGKILAKIGAESVYCISIVDKGIGIVMKTEDGNYRPLDAVIPKLLFKHDFINEDEYYRITNRLDLEIKNHRGQKVGEIVCVL